MILAIVLGLWLALGVISYGIYLHEYKRDFDYFAAFPFALFILSAGPFSLFSILICHKGSWGFDLKPYTREERWQNFYETYNQSGFIFKTREQFDREY